MTSIREQYLAERFNEWLNRFSPPKRIATDSAAQQRDADDMLRTVLRFAPREGYSEWLVGMLARLQEGMTTRSWPAPGEIAKACKAGGERRGGVDDDAAEENAINMLEDWFRKFKDQMPSMGRDSRTMALIARGVLKSEREAKFYGFNLDQAAERRARDQKMCVAEWNHHCRVVAKLRGITAQEAASQERARDPNGSPSHRSIPDKRAVMADEWGDAA